MGDKMGEAVDAFRQLVRTPAVVTIDLHRGHLDPSVATLPLDPAGARELLGRTLPILERYRALGVPIIHMVTRYRTPDEIVSNPYWAIQSSRGGVRGAIAEHNLEDGPGVELMPGVRSDGDIVIDTKQRYDCFLGTDLESVLRAGGHDSILLFGVNTNSCVLATAIAASVRDWAVFVIEDGVDTMMDREFHRAALNIIGGSFGWLLDAEKSIRLIEELVDGERALP
jgi:biuret amidohydrolase